MRPSPIPLYYQIANLLWSRIMVGAYPPGSLLGTEKELAERFAVSRITIRQALDILASEGLVKRERAKGTFVSSGIEPYSAVELNGFLDDLILQQDATGTMFVEKDEVTVPRDIALQMGVKSGSSVVRVRRVRSSGGKPAMWLVNHLPPKIGDRYTVEDFKSHTLLQLLDSDPDVILASGEQWIGARGASREVAKRLGVRLAHPVLYVEGVVYSDQGEVLEHVRIHYPADKFTYRVRLTRLKG